MADTDRPNVGMPSLAMAEHSDETTPTKKVSLYAYDIDNLDKKRLTAALLGTHVALDVNIRDASGNQITSFGGTSVLMADNTANPTIPQTASFGMVYDATNNDWERARRAIHGLDSTGTGLPVSAMLVEHDDTSPSAITENAFGNLRGSAHGEGYFVIRDQAQNNRGANVTAANELNVLATAQPGTDIGDVTINNASGGSAVNIQDGGNSITVDGTVTATATDLDIRDLVFATDKVDVSGSTVTANAGTNLNTSLLALESGGNLAGAATSLGLLDNSVDGNYLNVNQNLAGVDVLQAVHATDSTGGGIPSGAILGEFDDVSPTAITENRFGNIRMSQHRELYTSIRDAAQNNRGVNITAANEMNVLATAQPGVDIGDVTINNASIAVTATDLDIRDLTHVSDSVRIGDGTDLATVRDVTGAKSLDVSIVDGSGNQITSFGGGTQYTEGDVDASITGTAAMMEVGSNTLQPVQGTVADGLLVNLGTNNDVTVTSGAITETNSGAIKTAIEIIDDWDNAASDGASVSGDVAHDSGDAGEPVKVGFKAVKYSSMGSPVTANDRSNAYGGLQGAMFTSNVYPGVLTKATQISGTSPTDICAAVTGVATVVYIKITNTDQQNAFSGTLLFTGGSAFATFFVAPGQTWELRPTVGALVGSANAEIQIDVAGVATPAYLEVYCENLVE